MRRGRPPYPGLLTPREHEVLSLIRAGLTNEQIAERLGISESGARYHVSEILSKLGVESRAEAAQWEEGARKVRPAWAMGMPLIGSRWFKGAAVGMIAASLLFVLAIALGASVVLLRGSGDNSDTDAPPSGRELRGFLELSKQAAELASARVSGVDLYIVFANPDVDTFTFRFSDARWQKEVVVEGPQRVDPALPLWEVRVDDFPDGMTPSETLDLTGLEHAPAAVDAAARPALLDLVKSFGSCGLPYHFLVALAQLDGELSWRARVSCDRYVGSSPPPDLGCVVSDSDLSDISCDDGTQSMAHIRMALIPLAWEATQEALRSMPDAFLFQVNYEAVSGLYYFKFTEETPMHELHVVGPYDRGADARWEVSVTDFPNLEGAELSPLDVTNLKHDVSDIATAAATATGRSDTNLDVTLWSSFGSLQWATSGLFRCYVPDSDLAAISCGPYASPPVVGSP